MKPERAFIPLHIAVLTISDSRKISDDTSGDTLQVRLEVAGHILAARTIVEDDIILIRAQIESWVQNKNIDVIISTGGTGLTGRDVTPEAIEPLLDKKIDGFAILFHQLSSTIIGTSTLQSRSFAGIAGGKFIFCLPGSPSACRDAWDGILVKQLDHRHKPCNFVEIMPRLNEHLKK